MNENWGLKWRDLQTKNVAYHFCKQRTLPAIKSSATTPQYRINITLKCTGKKINKITSKISDSQVSKRKNNCNANGSASDDSSHGKAKDSCRQVE